MSITSEIESLLDSARAAAIAKDVALVHEHARSALARAEQLADEPAAFLLRAKSRNLLGRSLWQQLRPEEAVEVLLPVLAMDGGRDIELAKQETLFQLGRASHKSHRIDDALSYFQRASESAALLEIPFAQYIACNSAGSIYADRGDWANALRMQTDAAEHAQRCDEEWVYPAALNNLGLSYGQLSDHKRALELYHKVISLTDHEKYPRVGGTYVNMARIYEEMGHSDEALAMLEKGLAICERGGVRDFAANARLSIASVFINRGELDSALQPLQQGLKEVVALGNHREEADARQSLGLIWSGLEKFEDAEKELQRALAIYDTDHVLVGKANALRSLGRLSVARGDTERAREYFLESLEMAGEYRLVNAQIEAHGALADLDKSAGDFASSLTHLEEYHRLQQSRTGADAQETLRRMQVVHDVDSARKETELHRLQNVELAHALAELKLAQSHLVHSEKMASLGQLTAGIAHEINNPVNFIRNSTSPLRRDLDEVRAIVARALGEESAEIRARVEARMASMEIDELRDEIDALLRGIEEGAARTAEIVRGLRSFSRLDEDELKSVDLRDGIESTLTLLRPRLSNIKVSSEIGDLPPVECNPGQINQVFMNLLSNAVGAIDGKGEITIRGTHESGCVAISISDTGHGIPEDVRARIFEPFFTTKAIGSGTGLGLSISYGIVEKHGGTISVESAVDRGTTFTLTLPIQRA